jgi:hypothetical protein
MLRRIVLVVLALHFASLLLFTRGKAPVEPSTPTRVQVTTIQLKPKPTPAPTMVASAPTPKPKKTQAKKAPPPKKSKPAVAKKAATPAPNPIGYRQDLAERVQLSLRLPDFGMVKLEVTLDRSGSVQSVNVLSSASKENRDYVLEQVHSLRFIPFGDYFPGEKQHTFCLNLSHDS